MKKTLIICGHYPSPDTIGTTMRTINFVRFFRSKGSVEIAYSSVLPGGKTGNPLFSNEYYLEKKTEHSIRERLSRWSNIRNRPLPISRYTENSEKHLLSLMKNNNYDYILVRYVINTWSLFHNGAEYKKRAIIDYDDILSGSLCDTNIASAEGWSRKARLRLNQKYLQLYEKKCLNFGAALFCSQEDRMKIAASENGRQNAFVVPNIYSDSTFEDYDFGDGYGNGNTLLFVGTLNYGPNIQGLKWFVDSIFGAFKLQHPDARLLIVGRYPDDEVRHLCEVTAGLELHADVPDVRTYYRQCRAVVVPLLSGGGTRIKILEAAIAGRPVISTPMGAEGLMVRDDENIMLFEDEKAFCRQYVRLGDKCVYDPIVLKARENTQLHYTMNGFRESMERVLGHLNA